MIFFVLSIKVPAVCAKIPLNSLEQYTEPIQTRTHKRIGFESHYFVPFLTTFWNFQFDKKVHLLMDFEKLWKKNNNP